MAVRKEKAGHAPRRVGRPSATGGQSQVQSLTRALSLLERLSETDMGLSLSDVSASMGLAPSTAHRLLNTMLQTGFVEFDDEQGLWSVGVKSFSIGNAYLKKRNFVVQARPFMKELMLESGETCNLAIREDNEVIFLSQVECLETMRMVVRLGSRGPVHATGVGKALLAALPEEEALSIVAGVGMEKLTSRTLITPTELKEELAKIRKQGFSMDEEEQKEGLICFAANIYDEFKEAIAAVSISGPSVRVTQERYPRLSAQVMEAAAKITHAIGGQVP